MYSLQEPVAIELGSSIQPVGTGVKMRLCEVKDTFQYVPLLKCLKLLLQNQKICDEVSSVARLTL